MPEMSQKWNTKIVENSIKFCNAGYSKNPEQFTQTKKKSTKFAISEFKYKREGFTKVEQKDIFSWQALFTGYFSFILLMRPLLDTNTFVSHHYEENKATVR